MRRLSRRKGEEAPTLLKNPRWSSSLEPLTIMYGTPTYGKVDPTTPMAPFFFLFMGMCFGDAGYGLVVAGILGYFLVKVPAAGHSAQILRNGDGRHVRLCRLRRDNGVVVRRLRHGSSRSSAE